MDNPFDFINRRLDEIEESIENLILEIRNNNLKLQMIQEEDHSDLVKIDEAAKITGYKKGYLYELVCRNKIPFIKRGNSLRFDPKELDKWMKADRPDILKNAIQSL